MLIKTDTIKLLKPIVGCPAGRTFKRSEDKELFYHHMKDEEIGMYSNYYFNESEILANPDFFDLRNKPSCYVSGKITGLSEKASDELFSNAVLDVNKLGYFAVCPKWLVHDHDKSWLSYMRVDLKALCECDVIYMLENWIDSKGAKIEHDLAKSLGLVIIYQTV